MITTKISSILEPLQKNMTNFFIFQVFLEKERKKVVHSIFYNLLLWVHKYMDMVILQRDFFVVRVL